MTFNDVTSKDDLQDSSSWSSSPHLLLRDIHSKLLTDYNCKDGVSQLQEDASLYIPQLRVATASMSLPL